MRNELKNRLAACNQTHLIKDLDCLSEPSLRGCLDQIHAWREDDLMAQQQSWQKRQMMASFEPLSFCAHEKEQRIIDGPKTGVVILAGGQGSRLGISQPKGCFSLLGKSLFQRHLEKIRVKMGPAAILTSDLNHRETVSFFQENSSFGLPDIRFFSQGTLPLYDESGRWFWQEPGRIASGADGNGSLFSAFAQSGLIQYFEERQIQLVQIVPVDNALAEPFDPVFLSFHAEQKADLSIKCIRLHDPEEPCGRLVLQDGKMAIVEFAELSVEQKQQNLWANTGLLAIDLPFMRDLSQQKFPLHWAWRSATYWENEKIFRKPAWKAERFIVDALLFAKQSRAICYPREKCYAPLKDKDSVASIESLLSRRDYV